MRIRASCPHLNIYMLLQVPDKDGETLVPCRIKALVYNLAFVDRLAIYSEFDVWVTGTC